MRLVVIIVILAAHLISCDVYTTHDLSGTRVSAHEMKKINLGMGLRTVFWVSISGQHEEGKFLFIVSRKIGESYDPVHIWQAGETDETRRGTLDLNPAFNYVFFISNEQDVGDIDISFGMILYSTEKWFLGTINHKENVKAGGVTSVLLFPDIQTLSIKSQSDESNDIIVKSGGESIFSCTDIHKGSTCGPFVDSFRKYRTNVLRIDGVNKGGKEEVLDLDITFRIGTPFFPSLDGGRTRFITNLDLRVSPDPSHNEYFDVPIENDIHHVYWVYEGNDFKTSLLSPKGKEDFTRTSRVGELLTNGVYSSPIPKGSVLRIYNLNYNDFNRLEYGVIGFYEQEELDFNVTISDFSVTSKIQGSSSTKLSLNESISLYLIDGITGIYWSFMLTDPKQCLVIRIESQFFNTTSQSYQYKVDDEFRIFKRFFDPNDDNVGEHVIGGRKGLSGERLTIENTGTMEITLKNGESFVFVELDYTHPKVKKEKEMWYDYILREYWILIVSGVTGCCCCCIMLFVVAVCMLGSICCKVHKYVELEKEKETYIPLL